MVSLKGLGNNGSDYGTQGCMYALKNLPISCIILYIKMETSEKTVYNWGILCEWVSNVSHVEKKII